MKKERSNGSLPFMCRGASKNTSYVPSRVKKTVGFLRFLKRKLGKEINRGGYMPIPLIGRGACQKTPFSCLLLVVRDISFSVFTRRAIDDRPYKDNKIPFAAQNCAPLMGFFAFLKESSAKNLTEGKDAFCAFLCRAAQNRAPMMGFSRALGASKMTVFGTIKPGASPFLPCRGDHRSPAFQAEEIACFGEKVRGVSKNGGFLRFLKRKLGKELNRVGYMPIPLIGRRACQKKNTPSSAWWRVAR